MTARAKVILKKSMTHITGGRRWIKDVPHIIVGDDAVKAFEENGFFHTTRLKDEKSKNKKNKGKKNKGDKSKGKGKLKK